MNQCINIVVLLLVAAISGFSQIANVQFKDMKGNSYDLYALLGQGKHVLVHFSDDG